ARASGDPWFAVLAGQLEAKAAIERGDISEGESYLRRALEIAQAKGLEYTWLRVAYELVAQLLTLLRLNEAEALTQKAWLHARACDFIFERYFISRLAEAARRRGDNSVVAAFLDEATQRAPKRCPARRHAEETMA